MSTALFVYAKAMRRPHICSHTSAIGLSEIDEVSGTIAWQAHHLLPRLLKKAVGCAAQSPPSRIDLCPPT